MRDADGEIQRAEGLALAGPRAGDQHDAAGAAAALGRRIHRPDRPEELVLDDAELLGQAHRASRRPGALTRPAPRMRSKLVGVTAGRGARRSRQRRGRWCPPAAGRRPPGTALGGRAGRGHPGGPYPPSHRRRRGLRACARPAPVHAPAGPAPRHRPSPGRHARRGAYALLADRVHDTNLRSEPGSRAAMPVTAHQHAAEDHQQQGEAAGEAGDRRGLALRRQQGGHAAQDGQADAAQVVQVVEAACRAARAAAPARRRRRGRRPARAMAKISRFGPEGTFGRSADRRPPAGCGRRRCGPRRRSAPTRVAPAVPGSSCAAPRSRGRGSCMSACSWMALRAVCSSRVISASSSRICRSSEAICASHSTTRIFSCSCIAASAEGMPAAAPAPPPRHRRARRRRRPRRAAPRSCGGWRPRPGAVR